MGLFNRKATPAADPRADVADALGSLRTGLLDGPAHAQKSIAELTLPAEGPSDQWAELSQRREASYRAARELANWAGEWVELEPGWAPPPASQADRRGFANAFAQALYGVTLDVPNNHSYRILTEQGVDRDQQRESVVNQELPKYLGGIGEAGWGTTRLHKIADARLKGAIVSGYLERVPMWPKSADKKRGKVLADVYGKCFFAWLCWSQDHGLLTSVSDQLPRDDDPRVQGH